MGVADGLLVNIPVLGGIHLTWGVTVWDRLCEKMNFSSKRQSRILLANPRVRLSETLWGCWLRPATTTDFYILEKPRKENIIKSYR